MASSRGSAEPVPLTLELNVERGKRKRAEAKARKLNQQLRYAQKNKSLA